MKISVSITWLTKAWEFVQTGYDRPQNEALLFEHEKDALARIKKKDK